MGNKIAILVVLLMSCVVVLPAFSSSDGVNPSTMEKYQQAKQQIEALSGSSIARLAPEMVKEAGQSMAAAQNGLMRGNDKETVQAVEMALLQVKLAGALAEERAAAEKSAAAVKELAAFEQRLSQILTNQGDKP